MAKTLKDLRAVLRIATAAFAYPLHSERFSGAVKGTFPDLYGGGVPVLTHFDFAPVALVPGTKYVIGFTVTTTGAFVTLGAGGYDPGTYAGGGFFRWSTMFESQTADLSFLEGPAARVPEPASMMMFCVGLLGYATRRHFARHH